MKQLVACLGGMALTFGACNFESLDSSASSGQSEQAGRRDQPSPRTVAPDGNDEGRAPFFNPEKEKPESGFIPGQEELAQEDEIREAVFRYQFEHNASGVKNKVSCYYLSISERKDPTPAFLSRFDSHVPRVEPVSKATVNSTGVHSGLIFRIEEITWINKTVVHVEGGYYSDGLSASGNTYRVEWRDGKWRVTNDCMKWISMNHRNIPQAEGVLRWALVFNSLR